MKKLSFFFLIFCFSSTCNSALLGRIVNTQDKNDSRVAVVVIDPGHGGKDLGASVENVYEKDIALAISLKLGEKIESSFPDVKLVYTRKSDIFIPVYERADIANENKADLFISIHVNSVKQTYVKGAETYVLGQHRSKDNLEVAEKENAVILLEDNYNTTYEGFNPNSPESYIMFELVQDEYMEQSVAFASNIQNEFHEIANRADRSVKQAGFIVLRRTTMPSVLVEAGFITNADERKYMLSETGQNELAEAIFTAFSEYKKRIEDKSSFSINAKSERNEIEVNPAMQTNNKKSGTNLHGNITFSVQLSATSRKLKPTAVNFKGEKNVFRKNFGSIYKYFSGSFKSYDDAVAAKNMIKNKFPDAFVVAFKDDDLISVKMALEN